MVFKRSVAWAAAVLAACLLIAPQSTSAETTSTPTALSLNWSGYVASNAYYTGVSALIQTPVASPDHHLDSASVSSWIGIGGTVSQDLIQAGVNIDTSGPEATYTAWYETLPDTAQTTAFKVHPGDWVEVEINEVIWNLWEIRMVDGSQVLELVVPYRSSHSSAEWIVEDPLYQGTLVPLASVHAANFNKMTAIADGASKTPGQLQAWPMTLIGGDGHPRAIPSAVGEHGDSFTVPTTG